MTMLRALGLMSGTSMDGVDVALIETDGERIAAFGPMARMSAMSCAARCAMPLQ